ncbi:tripartite ATP-independent transporter solute receptor, DctP family [Desulfuromusa kysingii]|uniref:Tripartite ATP-independent transporter solute receptor, DctP family n=1 Tax=Desulfuromusa kysingii TaxID=37625 RepID=A0A1H3YBB1_9BACT|nr:TRAP transporter substrate-binding protein [Desulfuromusa kysingii]SEA08826.1 tripartite ATP-independent transporter solute receptor, DctP family [Desulfuromusa kysingii]
MNVVRCALVTMVVGFAFMLTVGQAFASGVTLHVGGTVSPEHSWYKGAEAFKEQVERETEGQVKVQIEMGGVHGGERKMVSEVMRGMLDMVWTSDIGLAAVFPSLGFVNLPYLLDGYEDVDKRYLEGWMGKVLEKETVKKGIVILSHGENDFRGLTNSKRPLNSGADFQGLKLRVPEVPIYIAFYRNLGALPTPMAITEVPTALQQRTVDGQDNGAIITYDFGLHQFQKYMTKANQIYSGSQLLINQKKYKRLTAEQQQIVANAAKQAAKLQVELNRAIVNEYYQKIGESGVIVAEATPQLVADMKVAAKKVWTNPETVKAFGKDIIDRIVREAE